ncbi:tyrosine-type recombinase/integrase [Ferrimicrobium acidiphilum]|uniref:tyrosine-type recombinase/integrase n=1 Tax=Ferrimicrobium acidiphilum TaxID=121039 RepID=UPI0023F24BA3|nr:tyrosine-type recombinase/integrase [Ferrimicrobium acidiphilum]
MSQLGMAKGSVTEIKAGVYRLRVDAGVDPVTGRRRQISKVIHGGKREANSALRHLINEVESGVVTNAKQTVNELMGEWLEFKRGTLSPKSIELYSYCMQRYILPALGTRKLTSLTPHDLDKFYGALTKKGVSAYGVRQVHATLRAALSQGVKWQKVTTNVAFSATPPQIPKKASRSITPEQFASIIAKANKDCDASLVRFFMLAALTGARRGEILGLRLEDLDTQNSRLRIARSVISVNGKATVKSTKTGQQRTIALDRICIDALLAQREEVKAQADKGLFTQDENPYLFAADPTGAKCIHPDWPSHVFRKVCDSISLPYHLHELRHFSATQLIAAGVDLRTVSGRLGHADPAITMRIYAHVVEAKDRNAADILGKIIKDVSAPTEPRSS